jgi:hypothetical protein
MRPQAASAIRRDVQRRVQDDPAAALQAAQQAYLDGKDRQRESKRLQRQAHNQMFRAMAFKHDLEARGINVIFEPGPEHRARQIAELRGEQSDATNQAEDAGPAC